MVPGALFAPARRSAGRQFRLLPSLAELSVEQATEMALRVWDEIDHPNLKENVEPTRDRARLILEKGKDHSVKSIRLRKI